jgi:hypothetical protein
VTLWAGTNKNRRGVGVFKIYSHPSDKNKLSNIFGNTFQDPKHSCFIRHDIFSSLYINSQYQYTQQYRSKLITGFLNYDISTVITDIDDVPRTIPVWILTVPDYHESKLSSHIQGINNSTLTSNNELQPGNCNEVGSKSRSSNWSSPKPNDYNHVFQQSFHSGIDVNKWQPPQQPEIIVYKSTHNSITKTISGVRRPPKEIYSTKNTEIDNQTTATANTAWSAPDNEISNLQSSSMKQNSLNHEIRMKQFKALLQNSIHDNQKQQTNVDFKIQQIEKANSLLQEEMETIMTTLPHLSTTPIYGLG